jgi:hypothetical protein
MAMALIESRTGWIERDAKRLVQVNLGWAYAGVGRSDDALRVLRQAAADDDVAALNNLGSILGRVTFPFFAKICCPHPTAQNGQTDFVTVSASWVRARLSTVPPSCRAEMPRPSGSSRRLRPIPMPAPWRSTAG